MRDHVASYRPPHSILRVSDLEQYESQQTRNRSTTIQQPKSPDSLNLIVNSVLGRINSDKLNHPWNRTIPFVVDQIV